MCTCICYTTLLKYITMYCLYKQIDPFHSIGVPKLTPGYRTDNNISRAEHDTNVHNETVINETENNGKNSIKKDIINLKMTCKS